MVWAWLWTARLCLAQRPYHLRFHWKASALTVLAKFHGFQYLSREQSEWAFWWPIPRPSIIPRKTRASKALLTFACWPQCHRGSWFEFIPHFLHLWAHLPNRQHRWHFLHTGCWTDIHRQPLVCAWCRECPSQLYKCKTRKKCCWQVMLRKG